MPSLQVDREHPERLLDSCPPGACPANSPSTAAAAAAGAAAAGMRPWPPTREDWRRWLSGAQGGSPSGSPTDSSSPGSSVLDAGFDQWSPSGQRGSMDVAATAADAPHAATPAQAAAGSGRGTALSTASGDGGAGEEGGDAGAGEPRQRRRSKRRMGSSLHIPKVGPWRQQGLAAGVGVGNLYF